MADDLKLPRLPLLAFKGAYMSNRMQYSEQEPFYEERIETFVERIPGFALPGESVFNNSYYDDNRTAGGRDLSSNPDRNESGNVIKPAVFGTFEVWQYKISAKSTAPGKVGGVINRPVLWLFPESASVRDISKHAQYPALREQAFAIAANKLIQSWGFYPAWMKKYDNDPVRYCIHHTGGTRDLPGVDIFWSGLDILTDITTGRPEKTCQYIFSVLVTIQAAETINNQINTSTIIGSIVQRDIIRYTTVTTQVRIGTRYKATLIPTVESLRQDYSMTTDTYPLAERERIPFNFRVEPMSLGDPTNASPFISPKPMTFFDPETGAAIQTNLTNAKLFRGDPWDSFAGYTAPQMEQLSRELFTSPTSFWDALGYNPPESLKGLTERFLTYFPGAAWLQQQGSAAPAYSNFAEALVYDMHLKKWGKMSHAHKLLFDLTPINGNLDGIVLPTSNEVQAGILDTSGMVSTFNDKPAVSELRIGKIGYHRLGFTSIEEVRANFRYPATGQFDIEGSLEGRSPNLMLLNIHPFTQQNSVWVYPEYNARWYNLTIRGHYDIAGLEVVGYKSSRR